MTRNQGGVARLTPTVLVLGLALGAVTTPLFAGGIGSIHLNQFELDGNPSDDQAIDGDDWGNVWERADNEDTNFFSNDGLGASIFTGGRKDIQEISQWSHKDGSVPDKDELTHAHAIAYDNTHGELVVNFGASRYANEGDAYIGYWFFAGKVGKEPTGKFSGSHTDKKDVLVLVNYPQGAPDSPELKVLLWDRDCKRAASNDPAEKECAAENLRLIRVISPSEDSLCHVGLDPKGACTITNAGYVDAPAGWGYVSKEGTVNELPPETFYEGAINLKAIIGEQICFSSFMAVTRSSSSFTASLKDFVTGDFVTCGMTVTKTCLDGQVDLSDDKSFIYPFTVTVDNTGFGTLYDIEIWDSNGTNDDSSDDFLVGVIDQLAPVDEPVSMQGVFTSTDRAPVNIATAYAFIQGGINNTTDNAPPVSADVLRVSDDECNAPPVNPHMSVSKECVGEPTLVVQAGGVLAVESGFGGQVCNRTCKPESAGDPACIDEHGNFRTGIRLLGVTLDDDTDSTPGNEAAEVKFLDDQDQPTLSSVDLGPEECRSYAGSYRTTTPLGRELKDTVTATATSSHGYGSVEASDDATCTMCIEVKQENQ